MATPEHPTPPLDFVTVNAEKFAPLEFTGLGCTQLTLKRLTNGIIVMNTLTFNDTSPVEPFDVFHDPYDFKEPNMIMRFWDNIDDRIMTRLYERYCDAVTTPAIETQIYSDIDPTVELHPYKRLLAEPVVIDENELSLYVDQIDFPLSQPRKWTIQPEDMQKLVFLFEQWRRSDLFEELARI